jgi:hypothetical protein
VAGTCRHGSAIFLTALFAFETRRSFRGRPTDATVSDDAPRRTADQLAFMAQLGLVPEPAVA